MKSKKFYLLLTLLVLIGYEKGDNYFSKGSLGLTILGGLVKVKPEKNEPFTELRLTNEDKTNITFIIKNMGEQGKLWLLVHKSELNEVGDKIQGVHPLKFITVIANNKYLKKVCMPVILNDYFKKKNFIEGLGANMTKEAQKGKIQKYMPDFLKEINFDDNHSTKLLEYTKARDWEGFIWYIVNG
jgi:hypothetical protein